MVVGGEETMAMLESYKEMDNTPYKSLKAGCPYSIFTDGIQKFSMELNGVMVRTHDDELIL